MNPVDEHCVGAPLTHLCPLQPARGLHNTIVSGANLRTRSNVWFGEPSLGERFYDTTTGKTFDPKSVPYSYNRDNLMKKSVVPLDYYSKCTRSWELTDRFLSRRTCSVVVVGAVVVVILLDGDQNNGHWT